MQHKAILHAILLVCAVATTANAAPAKPKPCPKGTVATTEKSTGKQVCFQPSMVMVGGGPQPILIPLPKPKPKAN